MAEHTKRKSPPRRRLLLSKRSDAAQHGTRSKYIRGCRCSACTLANSNYVRDWLRARKVRANTAQIEPLVIQADQAPAGD